MLDSFPGGGDRKGFYVQDGKLYDANGNEFIMRGINHAHTLVQRSAGYSPDWYCQY